MKEYELAELSPEDAAALTKELQEVLEKYNAEMTVSSNLHILQRVPVVTKEETKDGN